MHLYLIRHPIPSVEQGICYGRSDLSVRQEHVEEAVSRLQPILPARLPIYSSPALRCTVLAAELAQRFSSNAPILDSRLLEMDFGAWEMQDWNHLPRNEIDAWSENMLTYRPGGGETVMDVACRVAGFYSDINKAGQDAIVVCHAGTIRLLKACQDGGAVADIALRAAKLAHNFAYASLTIVEA
jgi:alpha-ribazole phosphatase